MSEKILYPIAALVKDLIPPEIAGSIDEVLDFLVIDPDHVTTEWTHSQIAARFRIYILKRLEFALPLLPGFMFRVGEDEGFPFFDLVLNTHPVPKIGIARLTFTVHTPSDILQAYERASDGSWQKKPVNGYDFTFATGLTVDADGSFDLKSPDLTGLPPFMIGDSGFILDFAESRSSSEPSDVYFINADAPEEIAQKVPPGFKGFYIARAGLHYFKPDSGTRLPRLGLQHAAIGSGGFTGGAVIGDEREEPAVSDEQLNSDDFDPATLAGDHLVGFEIAGMKMILWHLRVSFFQSVPDAFLLTGLVYMPFVNRWLKFKASAGGPNADFLLEVGGSANQPLINLNIDWLDIEIANIAYKTLDDIHYMLIDGTIRPKLSGFDWPKMQIENLSISSEGDIDIPGGWLKAPQAITLDFHGFKINITEIGMGTEGEGDDKREWFGVSGGISLVEGLPLKASVDGLKFSWHPDSPSDVDVSLRGIGLKLEIPNTLRLEGAVSYKKLGEDEGGPTGLTGNLFVGHAHLDLYALRTEVSAELLIGDVTDTTTGESFTAFFIVLSADLPTAIPLGATGAALFALKGLFGMHVAPDRHMVDGEIESWYRWYKEKRGGVDSSAYNVASVVKWQPQYDHYAFGAGITLGTQADDGFSINAGALVAILIPGPVVMIEGRANLLQERGESGKKAEGALYALAVFDGLASTFQLNVDVQYNLQDVIEVGGGLEAFFDFNDPNNWYIHIGKKEPQDKRIRAKVLSIITANSYLMIDPHGILTGAWVGVNFDQSYGPVRLVLKAFISFDAGIWWKKPQFEGQIQLHAEVGVSILGVGLGLILETILAGKAPQPYWIYGKARVALTLPFPLPSFDVEIEFEWGEEDRPHSVAYLKRADLIHHKMIGASWAMLSLPPGEEPPEDAPIPVVPVDATPVISFGKPLYGLSVTRHEDGSVERFAAERVDDWEFTYRRPQLDLHVRENDGTWTLIKQSPLRVSDISEVTPFDIRSENLLPDVYAREPQLLLWQHSPLSMANRPAREDFVPYCPTQSEAPLICFNWHSVPAGTTYPLEFQYEGVAFATALDAQAYPPRVERGLLNTPSFSMRFSEPMDHVEIRYRLELDPTRRVSVRAKAFSQGKYVTDLDSEPVSSSEIRLFLPDEEFNWAIDLIRVHVSETTTGSPDPGSPGPVVPGPINPGPILPHLKDLLRPIIPRLDDLGDGGKQGGHGRIDIVQVCYRTADAEQRRQLTAPDESSDRADAKAALHRDLQLAPNRTYRLTVQTTRTERQLGSADGETSIQDKAVYYFRTGDVPGSDYPSTEEPDFVNTPLNALATYIDQTIPNHGATNHYGEYDIALTFNESYARQFYRKIKLRLRDRNGKAIGEPVSHSFFGWLPLFSHGLITYLLGLETNPCADAPIPAPQPREFVYRSTDGLLAPNRMYSVEVIAPEETGDKVLHTFQFATSRFRTVVEHLTSGLRDGVQIVHTLPAGPAPDCSRRLRDHSLLVAEIHRLQTELRDLVATSDGMATLAIASKLAELERARDELATVDAELFTAFDAMLQPRFESLGLGQRSLPPTLELIRIPLEGTERSFLLLESPEPLDRHRLFVTAHLGTAELELRVIWNSDQTRAILCQGDGEGFESGAYTIRFHYSGGGPDRPDLIPFTHDGTVVQETVSIPIQV